MGAVANLKRIDLAPGFYLLHGSFTNTQGSADMTFTIQGRIVFGAVRPNSSAEPIDFRGDLFEDGSPNASGIRTVTIRAEAGVTDGTFLVFVKT